MVFLVCFLEHGLSGEYRTSRKIAGREGGLLRTHSPGMCYVSKQEGGRDHPQKHPVRPLEARMLLF